MRRVKSQRERDFIKGGPRRTVESVSLRGTRPWTWISRDCSFDRSVTPAAADPAPFRGRGEVI